MPSSLSPPMPSSLSLMTGNTHDATLFDRIIAPAMLFDAWRKVRANKGSHGGDGVTLDHFAERLERSLARLHEELKSGHYRPGRLRSARIPKKAGGTRRLAIPPVRDRIVQTAAHMALTPHLDALMSDASFAYRPGRSVAMALDQVRRLMASGLVWVVDADIRRFFDRVPHARLMAELAIWLNDKRTLQIIALWLRRFCLWPRARGRRGIAQGAPISPLLANLYLHPVDRLLAAAEIAAVRYADDLVLLAGTRTRAERAMAFLVSLLQGRGLSIHSEKSGIGNL